MTNTPITIEAQSNNDEPKYYFKHSATLRIFGKAVDFDEISRTLGLTPTHSHRRGDTHSQRSKRTYEFDMWSYDAPVSRESSLDDHLDALWQVLKPHAAYLKTIKHKWTVDVFCSYTSNCDHAGFDLKNTALAIFTELEIPFRVSVIVA